MAPRYNPNPRAGALGLTKRKAYRPLSAREEMAQRLKKSSVEASREAKLEREAESKQKAAAKAEKDAEKARTKAEREQAKNLKVEQKRLEKEGSTAKSSLKLDFLREISARLEEITSLQRSIKALRAGRAQSLSDMRKHRDRIEELRGEIKGIRAKAKTAGVKLAGSKKSKK